MSDKEKKKKKEKVVYIDDGRTIADMSGVGFGGYASDKNRPKSSARDKWRTYWEAVKMMFVGLCKIIILLYPIFQKKWWKCRGKNEVWAYAK